MTSLTTPLQSENTWHPIETVGRVRMLDLACITLRCGQDACLSCRGACPNGSLRRDGDGFSVSDECLGCGRCASACPTGALTVTGFGLPLPLPDGDVVRVECRMVPESIAGSSAQRVPCLGGVTPAQWLAIVENADQRTIFALDRGWCTHCAAAANSPEDHCAQPALQRAAAILAGMGWPMEARPRIRREPLNVRLMSAAMPGERPESLARRAFFRRFGSDAGHVSGRRPSTAKLPVRMIKRQPMPLPEREHLLRTTQRLSDASGLPMPPTPFVALSISSACRHHGVCAGICPTDALTSYTDGKTVGIEFNAWRCIACGQCERNCPEDAIKLQPALLVPDDRHPQRISSHKESICESCLQVFHGGNGVCPECACRQRLGVSLFGTQLAARTANIADFYKEVMR